MTERLAFVILLSSLLLATFVIIVLIVKAYIDLDEEYKALKKLTEEKEKENLPHL